MSGEKPRIIAARVLGRRSPGEYVEDLLDEALATSRLSSPDRHLCQELVYGAVRWQAALDWLIARKTNNRTQKLGLQNLLRLGLYQIFWLDRIPNHAAVHETVEMAKTGGFGPQSGFVNAVLRGYIRELEPTRQLLQELKLQQPALGFSHLQCPWSGCDFSEGSGSVNLKLTCRMHSTWSAAAYVRDTGSSTVWT